MTERYVAKGTGEPLSNEESTSTTRRAFSGGMTWWARKAFVYAPFHRMQQPAWRLMALVMTPMEDVRVPHAWSRRAVRAAPTQAIYESSVKQRTAHNTR